MKRRTITLIFAIQLVFLSSISSATTILFETNRKICESCANNIQTVLVATIPDVKTIFIDQKLIAIEFDDVQFISQDVLEDTIINEGYDITQTETVDETIAQIKAAINK